MHRDTQAILLCCLGVIVLMQPHQAHGESPWGTVAGQVVFAGDLNDREIRAHIDDIKIYEPQTIQDSLDRIPRRVLGTARNYALLIDKETGGVANAFVYLRRQPAHVDPAMVEKNPKPLELVYRERSASFREPSLFRPARPYGSWRQRKLPISVSNLCTTKKPTRSSLRKSRPTGRRPKPNRFPSASCRTSILPRSVGAWSPAVLTRS